MSGERKDELPEGISDEVLAAVGPPPEIPTPAEAEATAIEQLRKSHNNPSLQLNKKDLEPKVRHIIDKATREYNAWVAQARGLQAAADARDAEANSQQTESTDNPTTESSDNRPNKKGEPKEPKAKASKLKAKKSKKGSIAGKKNSKEPASDDDDDPGNHSDDSEVEYVDGPDSKKPVKLVLPSWTDDTPKEAGDLNWAQKGFAMKAMRKEDKKLAKKRRKKRKKKRRRRYDYSDDSSDSSESGPEWDYDRGGRRRRNKTTLQLAIERTPGDKTGAHTMDFLELRYPHVKFRHWKCLCLFEERSKTQLDRSRVRV